MLIAAIVLSSAPITVSAASVPATFSYQGRLTDASGNLLGGSGTGYYFKFSLWNSPTVGSGTRVWPASAPSSYQTTVRQGVFNVNIGDVANGYPDALNYNFTTSNVYLQVEVSSNNSSFETLSPRQQISSTAFAQVSGAVSGAEQSAIGTTTPASDAVATIEATTSSATALVVRGTTGQTAKILDVRNALASSLFAINASGDITASSMLQVNGLSTLVGGIIVNVASSTIANLSSTNSTTTNATTTNVYVAGAIRGAGLTSCSGSSDKLIWNAATGLFGCGVDAGGSGSGISGLGAQYSAFQTGGTQTLATSSADANIRLTITSSGDTHTFTPSFVGILSVARGGTGISNPTAAGVLVGSYAGGAYQQIATSSLGILTTDVAEGTNLYYQNQRVQTYLDGLTNKGQFFSTTSADYYKSQNNFFSTTSVVYWDSTQARWSTTSSDYYKSQNNFYSTTSADYFLTQRTTDNLPVGLSNLYFTNALADARINATNTLGTLQYLPGLLRSTTTEATTTNLAVSSVLGSILKTNANGSVVAAVAGVDYLPAGAGWSTTSSDYYKSVNNFFSTTSALYWDSTQSRWSTSSSDYYKSQNNFFSTTSGDYYASQFRDFKIFNGYLTPTTSQTILANNGFVSQASSTIVGLLTASNFLGTGSTTLQNFTGLNATTSQATTTNLAVSSVLGSILKTNGNGSVVAAVPGVDYATAATVWSTTSSDYYKSQNNFFSTTSADYYKLVNNFFSTTSANYWDSTQARWATSSESYYVSQFRDWNIASGYLTPTTSITVVANNGLIAQASSTVMGAFNTTGLGTFANILANGSSTLQNFTALKGTTTQATTTNLAVSSVLGALLKTNGSGSVVAAVAGQDYPSLSQVFGKAFEISGGYLAPTTSQTILANNGFVSQASSTINGLLTVLNVLHTGSTTLQNFTGLNATTSQATTTNLAVTSVVSSILKTSGNGSLIAAVPGVDYATVSSLWSTTSTDYYASQFRDFKILNGYLTPTTSQTILANNGFVSQASSTINALLTVTNVLHTGSTTLQNFTGLNATTSQATTTNLAVASVLGSLLKTNSSGSVVAAIPGTDYLTSASVWATTSSDYYASQFRDFKILNGYLTPTTSQTILANNGFVSQASSTVAGNLTISGNSTSTNATSTTLYLSGTLRGAGLVSCSAASSKLIWDVTTGQFGCGTDAGAGGGITAIGAQYSSQQTGAGQTFATTSDPNIQLVITSSSDTHTFAPSFIGTLSVARGGTGISNPSAAGVLLGSYAGGSYQQIATSSLGLLTTNVAEGSNLYYTDPRVQTYLNTIGKGFFFSTTSGDYYASQFRDLSIQGNGYLAPTTTRGILINASSTIAALTVTNGTTTNATSTNLAVSSIASGNLVKTTVGGLLTAAVAGTDYATIAQLWSTTSTDYYASQFRDFKIFNGYLTPTTSQTILANNGFVSQASSTIVGLLTASNFLGTGSTTLQNFTGLNATTSQATTTSFAVSSITNSILKTNASGSLIPAVAGSDYAKATDIIGKAWEVVNGYLAPTSTLGIIVNASSTINANLVINGNSTTTNATTTALAISSIGSSLLKTNANGSVVAAVAGVDYASLAQTFGKAFEISNGYLAPTTSQTILANNGFVSQASSTINGLLTVLNVLHTGSTTLQNFTALQATTSQATTTNLAVSSIASGSLVKTTSGGALVAAVAGSDYASLSQVFGKSFELSGGYLAPTTSQTILANNGFVSQASSTINGLLTVLNVLHTGSTTLQNFTGINATTSQATTTNLAITSVVGSLLKTNANGSVVAAVAGSDYASIAQTFGKAFELSGGYLAPTTSQTILANNGFVSQASSTINGLLTVLNVLHTGSTTLQNFTALNATTSQATTTNLAVSSIVSSLLKTNGQGSLIAAVAGSDYAKATDIIGKAWEVVNGYLAPTSTLGIIVNASSTINANLVINGNSTTTNATTTALAISSIGGSLLKTNAQGSVVAATAGTDYLAPSALFGKAFELSGGYLTPTTSQTILANNGFVSQASSTINGLLTVLNVLHTGSTTLQNFTGLNATTSQATTTNLAVSSILGSLLKTNANGSVVAAVAGSDYAKATDIIGKAWEVVSGYLAPTTTTYGILVNNASSTITNLIAVNATSTNATTTGVFAVSGSLKFPALADGCANITGGILGTTGLPCGAGAGSWATTSEQYYQSQFRDFNLSGGYLTPTTSQTILANNGFVSQASSTVVGLLTSSSFLTTGSASVGSSSPWAQLSVNPNGIAGPAFAVGSSTKTSFIVSNGGIVGINTSTPNPGFALDVNGGVTVSGTLNANLYSAKNSGVATAPVFGLNSGNGDTGMFFPSNSSLGFSVAGVESLSINSNGFVGIGSTTPVSKLVVAGTVTADGLTATSTDGYTTVGANIFPSRDSFTDNTGIRLFSNNSSILSGLVSEVDGRILSLANNVPQLGSRDTSKTGGIFRLDSNTDVTSSYFSVIRYPIGSTNPSFDFVIMPSGNVGVGTTSPSATLSVSGSAYITGATALQNFTGLNATTSQATTTNLAVSSVASALLKTNAQGSVVAAVPGVDYLVSGGGTWATSSNDYYASQFRDFSVNSFGALAPTTTRGIYVVASSTIGNGSQTGGLTINGGATTTGGAYFAGNVGIGKANPATALDVTGVITVSTNVIAGNIVQADRFTAGTGAADDVAYKFNGSTGTGLFLPAVNTLGISSNGFERIRIDSAGNVGIGTTSPFTILSVAGSAYIGGNLTATGTTALQNFMGVQATTTQATTTNLAVTSVLGSLLKTNGGGSVVAATAGTDYLAPSALFGKAFELSGGYLAPTTSQTILANNGFVSQASSTINALLTVTNVLHTGSTTLQNFTGLNATTSQATTTNLAVTSVLGSLLKTNANGSVVAAVAGSDYASIAQTFGKAFELSGGYLAPTTSQTILANNGFVSQASSTINGLLTVLNVLHTGSTTLQNFTGLNATTSQATTTNLAVTSVLGSLLKTNANGSVVAAVAGVDYASLAQTFGKAFELSGGYLAPTTSQTILANNGFVSQASSTVVGLLTASNFLGTGSTTLQNFTGLNATTSQATTTNLAVSSIASGSLVKTTTGGALVAAVAGSDYASLSQVFGKAFELSGGYLAPTTSQTILANNGFVSQASSTINALLTVTNVLHTGSTTLQNFTALNATTSQATTTNLAVSSIASGSLVKTTTGGALVAAVAGSDYASLSQVFGKAFELSGGYLAPTTSQTILANNGFVSQASSTVVGLLTTSNFLGTGSTTLQNFTALQGTTTQATTTNLAVTSVLGSLLKTNANGSIVAAVAGSDYASLAQVFGKAWEISNGYLAPTSTAFGILVNNASSTITNLTAVNGSTTNATTTGVLAVSGSLKLTALADGCASITGGLVGSTGSPCGAAAGSWATTSQDYYNSQFRDLSVQGNGYLAPTTTRGLIVTASSTIFSLVSNFATSTNATSTNFFATTASTTNFFGAGLSTCTGSTFLQWNNGVFSCNTPPGSAGVWATTSENYYASQFGSFLVNSFGALAPTTTRGLYVFASTTIGDSTQTGGLTINGGATTTANAYFGGLVGIGTTTPFGVLSVSNNTNFASFVVGSTSSTTLIVTNTGKVGIGTANPLGDLHIYNNNTSGAAPSIILGGNEGGDTDFWLARFNVNDSTNNDSFRIGTSTIPGANTLFTIDYTGNVGIGTTSPFSRLAIAGNIVADALVATSTTAVSSLQQLLANASTTLQNFTALQATTTQATTTNLAVSSILGSLLKTNGSGSLVAAVAGLDYAKASDIIGKAWEISNGYLAPTSTAFGILVNNASSTITNLTAVNGSTTNATSTNIYTSTLSVGSTSPSSLFVLNASGSVYLGNGANSTTTIGSGIINHPLFATSTILNGRDNAWSIATSSQNTPIFSISTRSSPVGLVGIGTSSPTGKLSVEMGTLNPSFIVGNSGSSSPSFFITGVNQNGYVGVGTSSPFAKFSVDMGATNEGISYAFVVGHNGSSTPSLVVTGVNQNGSVGVATSSPSALFAFSVGGSVYLGASPTVSTTTFGSNVIQYATTSTSTIPIGFNAWAIATSSAANSNAIFSISNSTTTTTTGFAATSTIMFFGATTTGQFAGAGSGVALPSNLRNLLIVGNGKTPASMAVVNGSICVDRDGWCTASTTVQTGGNVTATNFTTGQSDVAEIYMSQQALEGGDVVSVSSPTTYIHKADIYSNGGALGIVSSEPGLILGLDADAHDEIIRYPIALVGRIPTKVSTENGPIVEGDYLTLSSVPGVAAKATKASQTIGQALEAYNAPGVGKITVFVKNSYFAGSSIAGLVSGGAGDSQATLAALASGTILAGGASEINTDRIAAGVEIITPKITASVINAATINSPTIDALTARIAAVETGASSVSALASAFDAFQAAFNAAMGQQLTATSTVTVAGLVVNTIGTASTSVDVLSDTTFFGRPYFTSDTAGSAVIKMGARKVDIVFDRDYIDTPIVSATIALEAASSSSDLEEAIFNQDIRFIVTRKSAHGFTILLNKPASGDIGFSWIALAVKNAKLFTSRDENAPQVQPPSQPEQPPVTPPPADSGSGTTTPPVAPPGDSGTSTEPVAPPTGDSGTTTPPDTLVPPTDGSTATST